MRTILLSAMLVLGSVPVTPSRAQEPPPVTARGDSAAVRAAAAPHWAADQEGGGPHVFPDPADPRRLTGFEVEAVVRCMPDGPGWTTLFVGAGTMAVLGGLSANTVYRCRVLAYNAAGVASRPSVESQFVTPDSAQHEHLSAANAGRHFVVECGALATPADQSIREVAGRGIAGVTAGEVVIVGSEAFQIGRAHV
jgi:hypothetical protein